MVNPAHHHEHPTGHTPEMHDRPDEWHRHTTAEERPQQAHSEIGNPGRVLAVGLIAFLLVVVASVAVYLYYVSFTTNILNEREATGLEAEIVAARQDAMERFDRGYVWLDQEQGVVLLPYAEASRRVINEYTARLSEQQPRTGE